MRMRQVMEDKYSILVKIALTLAASREWSYTISKLPAYRYLNSITFKGSLKTQLKFNTIHSNRIKIDPSCCEFDYQMSQ